MLAAYSDEEQKLVVVVINEEAAEVEAGFSLDGFLYDGGVAEVIRTSLNENWAQLPQIAVQSDMLRAVLAPNSITTFVVSNVLLK